MTTLVLLLPERARLAGPLPAPAAAALGRADRGSAAGGGRAQLQRHFRLLPAHWPAAALTRQMDAGDAGTGLWLRADPAHVAPDLNGARLLGWGEGLGLDADDAQALLPALRPLFGDAGFQLDAPHLARWYLRLPSGTTLPPLPGPDEAVGTDLFAAMPQGGDPVARRWRALMTDVQVVLHQHPRNRERAAQGKPAINALWFWGAGQLPDAVQSEVRHLRSPDALLRALAGAAGIALDSDAAGAAASAAGDSLIDLRHLRGVEPFATQALLPLLDALARGEIGRLLLDFEDGHLLDLRQAQRRWRFWRRPLPDLAGG